MTETVAPISEATELNEQFNVDAVVNVDPAVPWILQRVRIKAHMRIAWLRKLWEEESRDLSTMAIQHAEVDAILQDCDNPAAEQQWKKNNKSVSGFAAELEALEKKINSSKVSRFPLLCAIFNLQQADIDLVQACFALQVDPALARLYAYLQDHSSRTYVNTDLVKRLFDYGYQSIFDSESVLRQWNLVIEKEVSASEPGQLMLDPMVGDWLLGKSTLDNLLMGKAHIQEPLTPLAGWPVEQTYHTVRQHMNSAPHAKVRLIVSGIAGCGRRTFSAVIAEKLGMPLLSVNVDALEQNWTQICLHATRQAFLDRNALCWSGPGVTEHVWPTSIIPFPIQFIIVEPGQTIQAQAGTVDYCVEIPSLTLKEREILWKQYIPQSEQWPENLFHQFIAQHKVTVGEIQSISQKQIKTLDDTKSYMHDIRSFNLGDLAKRLECPFVWDDLVLPQQINSALQDFVFEANERADFWENRQARRLFPQGRGLMALFNGSSGTGKTMSAQVIAAELGMDLYRIDLASVMSKYVGETSKNLQKVLKRTQDMDVVLLFDEADALLGKRTDIKDANDRFANTDTNFLLQELEDYQGIAILSTNKKSNIDDAFIRRIRYVVDFPYPDSKQRLQLWQKLLADIISGEVSVSITNNIKAIANTIEMSGAQIKYAILAALFNARRDKSELSIQHLLHGIDRELMKEGRVLTEDNKKRLLHYGR